MIIPKFKPVDVGSPQGAVQSVSVPNIGPADPANIRGELQHLSDAIGNYGDVQNRIELQGEELALRQQRAKETGDMQTRIVGAQKELEDFKTELNTKAEHATLNDADKMSLLKRKETELSASLINEETPQWQVDAFQAQILNSFGNTEQQLAALNAQGNAYKTASATVEWLTSAPEEAKALAQNSKVPTEEAYQTIRKSAADQIDKINSVDMPQANREALIKQVTQHAAKSEIVYNKEKVTIAGKTALVEQDNVVDALTKSPMLETEQGTLEAINIAGSMARPASIDIVEFNAKTLARKKDLAKSHTLSMVSNVANTPAAAAAFLRKLNDNKDGLYTYMPDLDFDERQHAETLLKNSLKQPAVKQGVLSVGEASMAIADGNLREMMAKAAKEKYVQIDYSSPEAMDKSMAAAEAQAKRLNVENMLSDKDIDQITTSLMKANVAGKEGVLKLMEKKNILRRYPADRDRLVRNLANKGEDGRMLASIIRHEHTSFQSPQLRQTSNLLGLYDRLHSSAVDSTVRKQYQLDSEYAYSKMLKQGMNGVTPYLVQANADAIALHMSGNSNGSQGKRYKDALTAVVGTPMDMIAKEGTFGSYSQIVVPNGVDPAKIKMVELNRDKVEVELRLPKGTLKATAMVNYDNGFAFLKDGQYVTTPAGNRAVIPYGAFK